MISNLISRMPLSFRKGFPFLFLAMCGFVSLGCGGDTRPPTFPVKGKLLVDGKPAHEAFIWFHPADPKGQRSSAQADDKGDFQISSFTSGDGAPVGDFTLTFEWPEKSGAFKTQFEGPDRLRGKYKDISTSSHKVTIDKQGKDLGTINLSTK